MFCFYSLLHTGDDQGFLKEWNKACLMPPMLLLNSATFFCLHIYEYEFLRYESSIAPCPLY